MFKQTQIWIKNGTKVVTKAHNEIRTTSIIMLEQNNYYANCTVE